MCVCVPVGVCTCFCARVSDGVGAEIFFYQDKTFGEQIIRPQSPEYQLVGNKQQISEILCSGMTMVISCIF